MQLRSYRARAAAPELYSPISCVVVGVHILAERDWLDEDHSYEDIREYMGQLAAAIRALRHREAARHFKELCNGR